jgi:hypothetical protein
MKRIEKARNIARRERERRERRVCTCLHLSLSHFMTRVRASSEERREGEGGREGGRESARRERDVSLPVCRLLWVLEVRF